MSLARCSIKQELLNVSKFTVPIASNDTVRTAEVFSYIQILKDNSTL